jgi:hypothetical protein
VEEGAQLRHAVQPATPDLEPQRGPFLTSPLGANFDLQGRSCPLDGDDGGEIICSPLHSCKK